MSNTNVIPLPAQITYVKTLADRLKFAREKAGLSQQALADLAGVSQGTIGNAESSGRKQPRALLQIANALKVNPLWLSTGKGSPDQGVAQDVSLDVQTLSPTVSWETLVTGKGKALPQVFKLHLRDEAMAPRMPNGSFVEMDRRLAPRPGDVVLVRDGDGEHYVRHYRERRKNDWSAVADNPAFEPLESERDGLSVVAVLVGGGWSGRLG